MHLEPHLRRRMPLLSLLVAASVFLVACNPIDRGLEFVLEGTWKDLDGITVEFQGSDGLLRDLGGKAAAPGFSVGSPFFKGVQCSSSSSCTAQQAEVTGQEVSWRDATISVSQGDMKVSEARTARSLGSWTRVQTGTMPSGELTSKSSCSEWWAALVQGGPWRAKSCTNFWGHESIQEEQLGRRVESLTLSFSGMPTAPKWTEELKMLNPAGTYTATDARGTWGPSKLPGQANYCALGRIAPNTYPQDLATTLVPWSLSKGVLLVGRSGDPGSAGTPLMGTWCIFEGSAARP